MSSLQRKEVRDDAGVFRTVDLWYGQKYLPVELKHAMKSALDSNILQLEPIYEKVQRNKYTQSQLEMQVNNAAFSVITERVNELYDALVQAEDPLITDIAPEYLGTPQLKSLQHLGITCVPVGYMKLNPANNKDPDTKQEPDIMRIVYASLDATGGILPRAWSGRKVPHDLVMFYSGVTGNMMREWLTRRRSVVESICRLYAMKIYTLTEFAWIHTNLAVLPAAIAEATQLLPNDTASPDRTETTRSITAKYAAMTASDEMVTGLRLRASAVLACRIDRVTVPFAAAYLDHYATAIPDMDDRVTDNKVARLLLTIIMKHTRVERGDAGALTLKCYDTERAYLSQVMDDTDRQKRLRWSLKGPDLPVHPAPTQPRPEAPGPAANPVGGIE